ncbi:MAG: respiratory nitrate reductase subunit gamma [Chromatiales bacterium]|nr:respiratory nitrate reductase subunit gamma [Chromatiales bacterium]
MSVLFALLFYVAFVLLVVGLGRKIIQYWKTPAPLKIPTTPAPTTRGGVAFRMGREVVLFESLFKSNKWIWLFGYMFHVGLALVLFRHGRYFVPEPGALLTFMQPFGKYAAIAMVVGLLGLWARRIFVERIRYITGPSDHLMLALLVGIGVSGSLMTFVAHTKIVEVKDFFQNVMRFNFGELALPGDPLLMLHLFLVAVLMIVFPLSKLLHAPGVFFSPSRNQVDNPREKRHIAAWAAEMEK